MPYGAASLFSSLCFSRPVDSSPSFFVAESSGDPKPFAVQALLAI